MRIVIATPVRPGVSSGNDVTSQRWARRLAELGHDVEVRAVSGGEHFDAEVEGFAPVDADVVIALHARRCAGVVGSMVRHGSDVPVVVGLAGTDLYADLPSDPDAARAISAAAALVVLQPAAVDRLGRFDSGAELASKAHVVHQSVELPLPPRSADTDQFVVAVLAHLRDVKDPLLAARAARLLAANSRIEVVHAGAAHDDEWHQRAVDEASTNARYRWLGELERDESLRLLASAAVLAVTSRLEGGANVVSEAIALGVPIIATRIDGTTGLVGVDHPGLVEVGDVESLSGLMRRCETDARFLEDLTGRSLARQHLTHVEHERRQWRQVLDAL